MGGVRTYNIVSSSFGVTLYDVDFGGHIRKIDPAVIRTRGYFDGHTRIDITYNKDRGIYEAKTDGEFPNFKPAFESKSDVYDYIQKKHSEGVSFQKIADYLNKKDVPTPSGKGKWYSSSAGRVLKKGFTSGTLYDTGSYPSAVSRIHQLKREGCSGRSIARLFNSEGVKTLSGRGQWYGASVGRMLKRHPLPSAPEIQTQTEKVKSVLQSVNNEQELQDRIKFLREQARHLENPDRALHEDAVKIARQKKSESSSQPMTDQQTQDRVDFLREQARKLLGK